MEDSRNFDRRLANSIERHMAPGIYRPAAREQIFPGPGMWWPGIHRKLIQRYSEQLPVTLELSLTPALQGVFEDVGQIPLRVDRQPERPFHAVADLRI